LLDELLDVLELRAATRWRLQQDSWQRNEPPRSERLGDSSSCSGSCDAVRR
jgi:hypothetical protein